MDTQLLKTLLKDVQKPAQYLGGEANAILKDFSKQKLRVCLVFPDAYTIGMSHTGIKILYHILNNIEGVVAERCFAPLPDMEAQMRAHELPLYSLESKTPLKEFDIIGFTLPYELIYTNVINILDLAQIPVWQKERNPSHPLILGGGTQCYNPEPVADFFDAFGLGDGEELIVDVVNAILKWKEHHQIDLITNNQVSNSHTQRLLDLTSIEGLYVPSLFEPTYNDDGTVHEIKNLKSDYPHINKRILKDINSIDYPTSPIIPNVQLVHDRIGIEIQRGCTRMCRFCQVGYTERPTRQRDPEKVLEIADKALKNSGIGEISLLSLSAGDYDTIVPTLKEMNRRYKDKKIAISVPATRTETLTPELIDQIKQVRMTGFTIAPEAGSERMRRVINKGNKFDDLLQASHNAFSKGYQLIKFYYMCGLPFEKDEDVISITDETYKSWQVGRKFTKQARINLSLSTFVPKPFTPFQWDPQIDIVETKRKHQLIRTHLKSRSITFKYHQPEVSYLEGLFARGDRRLSQLVFAAFKAGCRFDQWSEYFDFNKWMSVCDELKIDRAFYIERRRAKNEVLPWDHLFHQMKKDWLWQEYQGAAKEAYVADCSIEKCASFCGVCDFKEVKNKIFVIDEKPLAAKKGNREWFGRFANEARAKAAEAVAKATDPAPEVLSEAPALPEVPVKGPATQPITYKLRARYAKKGLATLFGHLELMLILHRAVLKCEIPITYTQGFHPHLKIGMGPALPLGVESDYEYMDLVLSQKVDSQQFIKDINSGLPQGLTVLSAEYIDSKTPSIDQSTQGVDYQIDWPASLSDERLAGFKANVAALKQGQDFTITRSKPNKPGKDKVFKINDYIKADSLAFEDKTMSLSMLCRGGGSLKPTEMIAALAGLNKQELNTITVRKVGVDLIGSGD